MQEINLSITFKIVKTKMLKTDLPITFKMVKMNMLKINLNEH